MTRIPDAARLIGTILLAQIQAAVFSLADTPRERRPTVSLYMDEFQNFATRDIEKLYSEGRKFGMQLTLAHQRRDQLPDYLQQATSSAYTKVCFKLTHDDSREMAHEFPVTEATVQTDDITEHPVHYLLTHPSDDPVLQTFTEVYLHPLQGHKRGAGRVEIDPWNRGAPTMYEVFNGGRDEHVRVGDPTYQLDSLLYDVMQSGNPRLTIPPDVVLGFSNCGAGFYKVALGLGNNDPDLTMAIRFPPALVVQAPDGSLRWTRKPEGGTEQFYHFIFHLRMVMQNLSEQPIGKATVSSPAEVARMLTQLPKRAAFVRSGDTVGVLYTHNTTPSLSRIELFQRAKAILEQTRETYCHPKAEVEQSFMQPAQSVASVQPVTRWQEIE